MAVDGIDAAGKTTLADELARSIELSGRRVARVSVDDFLRPAGERYRRGRDSPEGYYLDSFDYDGFRAAVIGFADAPVVADGIFLLRPELNDLWDLRIFVEVEAGEALRRALARDASRLGAEEELRRRHERRYVPGQRLYLDAVRPRELAELVLENTDPAAPVLRWKAR